MSPQVKVDRAPQRRKWRSAEVGSGTRGRSLASVVQRIEQRNPALVARSGVSSSAMLAGDLVRGMRQQAGYTQARLAELIGVSQARIAELESGIGTHGPTWDVMQRVAAACGQEIGVLPHPAQMPDIARMLRDAALARRGTVVQKITAAMLDQFSSWLGRDAERVSASGQDYLVLSVDSPKVPSGIKSGGIKIVVEPLAIAGTPAAISTIAPAGRKKSASD
ncbi:MAG TPA: helix-turn-helix transcriptional regulator [Acetobacteraceae bacterium]|nr:helix-turn-helix transcriptional regulator [Acetobacteraceae bacterium]